MMIRFCFLMFSASLLAGCPSTPAEEPPTEEPSGPAMGKEGGPCDPDGECFGDLACVSNVCVDLGSIDGNTDGNSEGSVEGSISVDAGASDGSGHGNISFDAGSGEGPVATDAGSSDGNTDGTTDGSEVLDSGSSDGSTDGLACVTNDECIYTDLSANLIWQGCPAGQSGEDCTGNVEGETHANAVTYCEDLSWGGFDDWVLPNIDELRSLIRGCPTSETGGSCPMTHQCSYSVDNNCAQVSCSGCDYEGGLRSDGCYFPADLPGACSRYWSSSLESEFYAYTVLYNGGNVGPNFLTYTGSKVRCVRSQP